MDEPSNMLIEELRTLLEASVKRNLGEGVLLSGGLDSSIVAAIGSKLTRLKAFTVGFEGSPAPDIQYAELVARELGIEHRIHFFEEGELYEAVHDVIRALKTFDPMEVRNSAAVYIGLRLARDNGVRTIMTGDGADELFAGYSFLYELSLEELELRLREVWRGMRFSASPLGRMLGVEVKQPYLDPEFKSFAMRVGVRHKKGYRSGILYGKFILREAFEGILPEEILWRVKTPIECGSGTTTLPKFFEDKISDERFSQSREKYLEEDGVLIRSKEQLFYYEIYREIFGAPHPNNPEGRICPFCHSSIPEDTNYCRTCGAYNI